MRSWGGWVVAGLLASSAASAQPIKTDRPGEADPPNVVPPGRVLVESGFEISRSTGDDPDTDTYSVPNLLLRFGVVPNLELRLEAEGFVYQDRGGAPNRANGSDFALEGKVRFLEQKGAVPMLGALLGLRFPTGSRAVTSDGFDPFLKLLGLWELGERFAVVPNLRFAAPTLGVDDPRRIFELSPQISFDAGLTSRVSGFVEYFGDIKTGGEADEHSIDGGFSWLVTDDLQLDLSAGGGLVRAAPDWFVSGGLAFRFHIH